MPKLRGAALVACTLVLSLAAPAAADAVPAALAGWGAQHLAPGLTLFSGTIGQTGQNTWTVTVLVPGGGSGGGSDPDPPPTVLGSRQHADDLANSLRAKGFQARTEEVDWAGFSDTPQGALGWRVRVGAFTAKERATAAAADISAAGFKVTTEWTGQDGPQAQGPERLKVAVVDPRSFAGKVTSSYGQAVSGRETTSAISSAAGALVGVNGGFFVIDPHDGIPGEPAGISVQQGKLEHEATNGRVALVLDGHPRISRPTTEMSVHTGSARRTIDGINRIPGIIRNCGEPGDLPTSKPLHDITCTHPDELVLFTPELGVATPSGDGVEAVLDSTDRVTTVRQRGGVVPAGSRVLQGIGAAATWLTTNAKPGIRLHVDEPSFNGSVINGGPRLVHNGRVEVNAAEDGVVHPGDPSYVYSWAIKRNPRTMVGIDRLGRLLVVTVDGRQPGYSEGFSLLEGADFLRSLGARDAINLDGGGSTAMAVNGRLATSPSDATGERPIGDALLILPQR